MLGEIRSWRCEDVLSWLSSIQLDQYAERFKLLKVDGQMLMDLIDNEADLVNDFHVKIRVHRSKLMRELRLLASDNTENRQVQRGPQQLVGGRKQRARTPHARHIKSEFGNLADPGSPRIHRSRSLSTNFVGNLSTNNQFLNDAEHHVRRLSLSRQNYGTAANAPTPLESPSQEYPRRPAGRAFVLGQQCRFHRSDSGSSQMSSRSSVHLSSCRGGQSCFSEQSSPCLGHSFMRLNRIYNLEANSSEQHLNSFAERLVAKPVDKFLQLVLRAMTSISPRATRVEQLGALEMMVDECVHSLCNEGYFCVDDLLQDLDQPDFKSDLRKYGMKKRFLNELCGTLIELRDVVNNAIMIEAQSGRTEIVEQEPRLVESQDPPETKLLSTLSSQDSKSDDEDERNNSAKLDNLRQAQAAAHALQVSSDKSRDLRLRRNHTDTALPEIRQRNSRAELRPGGKVRLRRRSLANTSSLHTSQAPTRSQLGEPDHDEAQTSQETVSDRVSGGTDSEDSQRKSSKARSRNRLNVDIQAIELEQDVQRSYNFGEEGLQYGDLLIGKSGVVGAPGIDQLRDGEDEEERRRADLGKMQTEIKIVEQVGKGSGGVVFRGVHLPSKRSVAVKQVVVNDNSQRRQMRRELDTLLYGLDHPNIVRFYDSFSNPKDGTISMVFEFMDAGSLQDIVDCEHPVPAKILQKIALHCLLGLNYLHALKYMHRDIKPSNLLISHTGDVKIADFGIAKEMGNTQAMASTYLGTFMYMSPERVRGADYSFDSDIWSLGLSLLTCSLGRYPFQVSNGYWGLAQAIRENRFPKLPEDIISDDLGRMIMSCVDHVPENRPSTKALLRWEIFTLVEGGNEDVLPLSNASRQDLEAANRSEALEN